MTDRPVPNLPATPPTTAVAAQLSPEDITQAMIAAGLITPAVGGADFNRVRVDGQRFIFGDKENPDYIFDSPSNGTPAFRCQIVSDAIEYNGRWFDEVLAQKAGRPTIAGKMCKTHLAIPEQAGQRAEDGTPCQTCPVYYRLPKGSEVPTDANGIAKKCGGMLDVEFRLLDDNGQISDERVWTLSMSFTGLMEWQGSFSDKAAGYVSETNFKRKLATLAATRAGDPAKFAEAIIKATQSLQKGGVLAEGRILRAEREGNRFSVPSFNPFDIIEIETAPALASGDEPAAAAEDPGDIPF